MTFALYIIGFVILTFGLAMAANRLGVSDIWIAIGVIVMIGLGILTGATQTRRKDPSQ